MVFLILTVTSICEVINGILNCVWYNFYIYTQVSIPGFKKVINELRIMITVFLCLGSDCTPFKWLQV